MSARFEDRRKRTLKGASPVSHTTHWRTGRLWGDYVGRPHKPGVRDSGRADRLLKDFSAPKDDE